MNSVYVKFASSLFSLATIFLLSGTLFAQTVSVAKLPSAPILDGSDNDWQNISPAVLKLNKSEEKVTVGVPSVSMKAGIFGDDLYLFLQWEDATKDDQHKPFIWNAEQNKYVAGEQKEDRLALQFEMTGDYSTNWMSGSSFEADMWHWKAARSNPLNLMHDKMTIIGTDPVKKAYKANAENGSIIYIQRPSDKGDKLYTTKRSSTKEEDVMPKYILADNPQGSIADVQSKGVWKDGRWNLEVRRKLDTGNPDDVDFSQGKTIKAGLAVFDHSGDENHVISDTFTFEF